VLGPAALDSLFTAAVHRLDAVRPGRRRDAALDRLEQARRRLSDPARQVVLRDDWLHGNRHWPITCRLRCPIDVAALRAFAADPRSLHVPVRRQQGLQIGKSYREYIEGFLEHVQLESPAEGYVDVSYRHSELGAALVGCGLVRASREYGIGPGDPMKLPSFLRALALRRFSVELDDKSAHLRACAALLTPGSDVVARYLQHRDAIHAALGERVHPHDAAAGAAAVKVLFLSINMDGTVEGWKERQGLPRDDPILQPPVRLPDGATFDMRAYARVQEEATVWLADRWLGAGTQFIATWSRLHERREAAAHPERTL
jgi:hypothetical protein